MNARDEQIFETVSRFAQAYQVGNLQGALSPFSPSAKLVAADGETYVGLAEIRARLCDELGRAVKVIPRNVEIRSSESKGLFQSTYDLIWLSSGERPAVHGQFTAELSVQENRWQIDSARFALADTDSNDDDGFSNALP